MAEARRDAGLLPPTEIVARLHQEIAAKSPGHAALAAEFERRQAARAEAMPDGEPDYEWRREMCDD